MLIIQLTGEKGQDLTNIFDQILDDEFSVKSTEVDLKPTFGNSMLFGSGQKTIPVFEIHQKKQVSEEQEAKFQAELREFLGTRGHIIVKRK